MAPSDRRSELEQEEQRRMEEERRMSGANDPNQASRERMADPEGRDTRRDVEAERRRGSERDRDQGAWPYAGPLSAGSYRRQPVHMGYPGWIYPWSRFSHGTDPSYEDWQGPGFGTHTPGGWEPRVETFRRGEDLIVRVELPGWDKDDVEVFVEDEDLVVEGRREESDEDRGEQGRRDREERREERVRDVERMGRHYAAEHFSTRVSLPGVVDADDLKAKFKNGVLEVRIRMPERQAERRKVKIDT